MYIEYWPLGSSSSQMLLLTHSDFSKHLLSDWIPSLPVSVSSAFVGWPPYLIETVPHRGYDLLSLRVEVGRSERQWKGVLSWMIGVVGTRHLLEDEGYRWIAPMSAFYPSTTSEVNLSLWHPGFPKSSIVADKVIGSHSRLRPDYIALRSGSSRGTYEWAVAESKGTSMCLSGKKSCPKAWYNQVHNVSVSHNGTQLLIPRHIVVATRSNPNAKRSYTRRLQLRGWNTEVEARPQLSAIDCSDIVAAYLFGLCRGLRLTHNAMGLAVAVQARRVTNSNIPSLRESLAEVTSSADNELRERLGAELTQKRTAWSSGSTFLETEGGGIEVELDEAIVSLIYRLRTAVRPSEAGGALQRADRRLDDWNKIRREEKIAEKAFLPTGVRILDRRSL